MIKMFVYKVEWNAKCDPNPEINGPFGTCV